MFMRYRGGGVGHLVTRFCNKKLAMDKHPIPWRHRRTQSGNTTAVDKDTRQPGFEDGSDGDEEDDIDNDNIEHEEEEESDDEDKGNESKDEDEDEDEGAGAGEREDGLGEDEDEDKDGDQDRDGDQRILSMLGYGAL